MNRKTHIFSLMLLIVLLACEEKEKKMETSSDMLFTVRGSAAVIELSDQSMKSDIEAEMMKDFLVFINNKSVIEMKLKDRSFDVYQSLDKFKKDKIARSGIYKFSSDEMSVTYAVDNKEYTFSIGGPLGNTFYNHFVRRLGATESHIINPTLIHSYFVSLVYGKGRFQKS